MDRRFAKSGTQNSKTLWDTTVYYQRSYLPTSSAITSYSVYSSALRCLNDLVLAFSERLMANMVFTFAATIIITSATTPATISTGINASMMSNNTAFTSELELR